MVNRRGNGILTNALFNFKIGLEFFLCIANGTMSSVASGLRVFYVFDIRMLGTALFYCVN